jgi:hypothetical protein
MMLSGLKAVQLQAPGSKTAIAPGSSTTDTRNFYSPNVLSDPYVLQQHREIVEALEISCRKTGEHCAEAKQARRYLDEREATRTR